MRQVASGKEHARCTGRAELPRLLIIDYSDNGRYHEHLFNRTIRDGSMVYIDTAGKEFDDSTLGRCSHVCGVPTTITSCTGMC